MMHTRVLSRRWSDTIPGIGLSVLGLLLAVWRWTWRSLVRGGVVACLIVLAILALAAVPLITA